MAPNFKSFRYQNLSHTCGVYYLCDKPELYHTGPYQIFPAWITRVPRFNALMALLSRSIDTCLFVSWMYNAACGQTQWNIIAPTDAILQFFMLRWWQY